MRHRKKGRKLGRTSAHKRALMSNLASAVLLHEKIKTTEAKAKEVRGIVDRLISWAKRGDLQARRLALRVIPDKRVIKKLFDEIAPRYADRPGGYTRITRIGPRKGDGAVLTVFELVEEAHRTTEKGPSKEEKQAGGSKNPR